MKTVAEIKQEIELFEAALLRVEEEQKLMRRALCGCVLHSVEQTVDSFTKAVMDIKIDIANAGIQLIIAQAVEAGPSDAPGAVVVLHRRAF